MIGGLFGSFSWCLGPDVPFAFFPLFGTSGFFNVNLHGIHKGLSAVFMAQDGRYLMQLDAAVEQLYEV